MPDCKAFQPERAKFLFRHRLGDFGGFRQTAGLQVKTRWKSASSGFTEKVQCSVRM